MDITLSDYGYCNFISNYHACLIIDKVKVVHYIAIH